jgi:hypothetical protein
MDGRDRVHSFGFHDYTTLHENVQPEPEIKPYSIVDHRQRHLHSTTQSSVVQLMHQTSQIHALQEAGPNALWTFMAESTTAPLMWLKCISVSSVVVQP